MRLFLFFSALITFAFIACEKTPSDPQPQPTDKTGTIELVFKGRYDGVPMPTFSSIMTNKSEPTALTFKKLEFFISQLQGKTAGKMIDLADVGYVSLTNLSDATGAEQGFRMTIKEVPVGKYSQLKYGIGLSNEVNDKSPGDYESTSPLGINANYWASWNSYIFCKIEGDATLADGSTKGFLYHAGVNGMYQTRSFDKEFTVNEDANTVIMFHINMEDLFFKSGQEIDVTTDNSTHSGVAGSAAYVLAERALTNLADALHLHQ